MPARAASPARSNSDSKTSISPVMSRYADPATRQPSKAARDVEEKGPAARTRAPCCFS